MEINGDVWALPFDTPFFLPIDRLADRNRAPSVVCWCIRSRVHGENYSPRQSVYQHWLFMYYRKGNALMIQSIALSSGTPSIVLLATSSTRSEFATEYISHIVRSRGRMFPRTSPFVFYERDWIGIQMELESQLTTRNRLSESFARTRNSG